MSVERAAPKCAAAALALPVERVELRVEAAPRGPRRPADADPPPEAGVALSPRSGVWFDARLDAVDFGFVPSRARALVVIVPLALLFAACAAHGLLHSPYSPLRVAGARRKRGD